jgi:hypothetical protein
MALKERALALTVSKTARTKASLQNRRPRRQGAGHFGLPGLFNCVDEVQLIPRLSKQKSLLIGRLFKLQPAWCYPDLLPTIICSLMLRSSTRMRLIMVMGLFFGLSLIEMGPDSVLGFSLQIVAQIELFVNFRATPFDNVVEAS